MFSSFFHFGLYPTPLISYIAVPHFLFAYNPPQQELIRYKLSSSVIKIDVSVLMEFSGEWNRRLADFQEELIAAKLVNEQGEIYLPSYTYLDKIFEIARKHAITVILHS